MEKPFDLNFRKIMELTTKYLVNYTNANIGYTQSDEITLVLYSDNYKTQVFLDGKRDKLNSLVASKCSVYFNSLLPKYFPERVNNLPTFDCRSFNVPTLEEGVNAVLWRELDATKNSISMLAQFHFSHNTLHKKNTKIMLNMLNEKGINWNDLSSDLKRGTYIQRVKRLTKFSAEELDKLPLKHDARNNPDLMIERSVVERVEMPILMKIINRVGVIFNGEQPVVKGIVND